MICQNDWWGSSIPFLDTREFNREVLLEKSHPCSVLSVLLHQKKNEKACQSKHVSDFLSFFSFFFIFDL